MALTAGTRLGHYDGGSDLHLVACQAVASTG